MNKITRFAVVLLVVLFTFPPVYVGGESKRMNSTYIYFGNPSSYLTAVNNVSDPLDVIYPSYFDLNTDGSLKLTTALSQSACRADSFCGQYI